MYSKGDERNIPVSYYPEVLLEMAARLKTITGFTYNTALGNKYVNGKDYISRHQDFIPKNMEKAAGIVTVIIGFARPIKYTRKRDKC